MTDEYNPMFANHYKKDVGVLHIETPYTARGKKLFTWSFSVPRPSTEERYKNYEISIHLKTGDKLFKDVDLYFEAQGELLLRPLASTDINKLKEAVEAEYKRQVYLLDEYKWEDWLEITTEGSCSEFGSCRYNGMGADVKVSVKKLKKTRDEQGNEYTINSNGIAVDFPKPVKYGEMVRRYPDFKRDTEMIPSTVEISYILDTPENVQALSVLTEKMKLLKKALNDLCGQQNVHKSLVEFHNILQIVNKENRDGN